MVEASEPFMTFEELLQATGAEQRFVRSLIDRDPERSIGIKDERLGRLLFSLQDAIIVALIFKLNTYATLPPKAARAAANAMMALIMSGEISETSYPNEAAATAAAAAAAVHVAQAPDGHILAWRVDHSTNPPVPEVYNCRTDDDMAMAFELQFEPHIVIPFLGMFKVLDGVMKCRRRVAEGQKAAK